jgi:predicted nucleic acid-binding protein
VTYLVDTDVLSEVRKGPRGHPGVRRWFADAPDASLHLSVVTVGELRRVIELRRRTDRIAATALEQWLARVLDAQGDRILPVDRAVAERWGQLGIPDRLPVADGLIAATALVHDLTLVTRNVRDMARTGVRILDPFATT